jgi:hypothetical protein
MRDNFRILFNLQGKTGYMLCKNNRILKFVCGIAVFISCSTTKQSKLTDTKPQTKAETMMIDTARSRDLLETYCSNTHTN